MKLPRKEKSQPEDKAFKEKVEFGKTSQDIQDFDKRR